MKSLIRLTPSVVPSPSFSRSINGIFNIPLSTLFTSSLRAFCRSRRPLSFHPLTMASSASQSSLTATPVDGVSDVFQLIQAHQAAAPRLPPVEEVRTILDNSIRGMLSTFSKEHEGYPSGSMVDFACDHDGSPVLAVSHLAGHSKNLLENPKCSLLVAKDPEDRTDIVITLFGDAVLVSEDDKEAVRAAYLRRHPNAFWVDFGDFCFIQIRPKFVHFVSGVATALLGSGDFNAEEFRAAKVDPMSQFSVPISLRNLSSVIEEYNILIQKLIGRNNFQVDFAYILDVDSLGFNVKVGCEDAYYRDAPGCSSPCVENRKTDIRSQQSFVQYYKVLKPQ
ncbi:hypothetical protein MA16_Dca012170 [Dendrobium catenatum]|uniref:CREG-like beta-barrel domain-containing protein n=1 Tax=Dendrobium catenatum TaxID=906689 RepID=A0A2I0VPV8_9ASPA|nr:hypothetical protein MA16_Dca012170 [Dendrobium catenatum]